MEQENPKNKRKRKCSLTCPKCGGLTIVERSVTNKKDTETYRRRRCLDCRCLFYTVEYEVVVNDAFTTAWDNNGEYAKKK